MEAKKEKKRTESAGTVIKILFAMYIVTGLILVLLAALLYKFNLNEKVINAGIIAVYIIAGFMGGFLIGKVKENHKFLWGLMIGGMYFAILILASVVFQKSVQLDWGHLISTMILCLASGMAGGMVS